MSNRPTDTRAALIEAALFCFAEHGFEGTSIRMIAKQAGRPLSLIGHHFGGKEGLYLEVFRTLFLIKRGPDLEELETERPAPRNRAEAVSQFREQVHLLYRDLCPAAEEVNAILEAGRRLWLMELRDPKAEILALIAERLGPWVKRVRLCLAVLRPDMGEAEVSFLGSTLLSQITGQGLIRGASDVLWGPNRLTQFRSAEFLTEFSLLGLGVQAQAD